MMLSGVSSRKARGRTDGFMSWKPRIQWPKVHGTVIWPTLALSHLLIKVTRRADSANEHFCPLWLKLFPPAPGEGWGVGGKGSAGSTSLWLTLCFAQLRAQGCRAAELVFTLPQVSLQHCQWSRGAESLFPARREKYQAHSWIFWSQVGVAEA